MDDEISVPTFDERDDGAMPAQPNPEVAADAQQDRYAMPPETEPEWGAASEVVQDRYAIPEPEEIVPTYVRHEAPWVGFGPAVSGPPAQTAEEMEFTRILRRQRRWKETLAWLVTGAFILTAAWFMPILLVPTSQLGRVGSFAALAIGGFVALAVLWRTWHWAHGKD